MQDILIPHAVSLLYITKCFLLYTNTKDILHYVLLITSHILTCSFTHLFRYPLMNISIIKLIKPSILTNLIIKWNYNITTFQKSHKAVLKTSLWGDIKYLRSSYHLRNTTYTIPLYPEIFSSTFYFKNTHYK